MRANAHRVNSAISPVSEGAVPSCGVHAWRWAADFRVAEWIPPHVGARVPYRFSPIRPPTGLVFVLSVWCFDSN